MPYKDPNDPVNREKRNSRRRALRLLKRANASLVCSPGGLRKLFNPGPFRHQLAEVKTPTPVAAPLTWIDRAQVAAYGYSGALRLDHF